MRKSKGKFLAKTIFIFGEGDSEKYYFNILKRICTKYKNFKYIKNMDGFRNKENLTKTFTDVIDNINKITKYSKSQIKETNSKIIFVLDADIFSYEEIEIIKKLEKEYSFLEILFNNEKIEDFLLLHLKYFNIGKNSIKELEKNFGKIYEKGFKGIYFYEECIKIGFENDLLKNNLEKLEKFHGNKKLKDKIPFSELGKILF